MTCNLMPPLLRRWLAGVLAVLLGLGPLATPAYSALIPLADEPLAVKDLGQAEHRSDRRRLDVDAVRFPPGLRGEHVLPRRHGRDDRGVREHRRGERFHRNRRWQILFSRVYVPAVQLAVRAIHRHLRPQRAGFGMLCRQPADVLGRASTRARYLGSPRFRRVRTAAGPTQISRTPIGRSGPPPRTTPRSTRSTTTRG